jgi:ribosome-binding factor A
MSTRKSAGPSQRQLRVGEEIRHALARILTEGDLRDPELQGVSITVSEVRPSPDMRNATAFVTPLGGENAEAIAAALNRASRFLRGRVAQAVHLRNTPALSFLVDRSFDEAEHVGALLRDERVARDLKQDNDAETDPETDGA